MSKPICDFCSENESVKAENMGGIAIYLCKECCLKWRIEIKEAICYEESENS